MVKSQYQSELDLARIFGALSVVLFHYTFRGFAANDLSILHFPVLGSIFKYGYLGIYLFFIMSGYTVVMSMGSKGGVKFIFSRMLRLYPSFWIAICITSVITILLGGGRFSVELDQVLVNLTMLGGFIGAKPVDGVYWFLLVMLKFYFLITLLLVFGLKRFYKYVAGIWLVISIVTTVWQIPKIGFFLIPEYSPFLAAGMIFYAAREEGWDLFKAVVVLVSLLFALYLIGLNLPEFEQKYGSDISLGVVILSVIGIYLFMLFVSVNKSNLNLPKVFVIFGACTYPLYLIHQNIGYMLFNYLGAEANKYVLLLGVCVLMFLASFLIVKYFDPLIVKAMKRVFKKPGSMRWI